MRCSNTKKAVGRIAGFLCDRFSEVSSGKPKKSPRIIVVLGAGASNTACGIPTGKCLAKKVRGEFVKGSDRLGRLVDTEIARLSQVNHLNEHDFETILLALSKFDPDGVRNTLLSECGIAHYPSFAYEFLAHLMKHGFLDAIINFNFDELLDDAIYVEVGDDGYSRIIRDGGWMHTLRSDPIDPKRFDKPLYIKPHGTIGDPASLRFTREAYYQLPPDLTRLLTNLMNGESADAFVSLQPGSKRESPGEPQKVYVVVLGHALESFEFNNLLAQCPTGSELYISQFQGDEISTVRWPNKMSKLFSSPIKMMLTKDFDLNSLLHDLWRQIERECATRKLSVRGIERHELIAELFDVPKGEPLIRREPLGLSTSDEEKQKFRGALTEYFRDRFLVETMLAIAKSKGFIDVRELNRGRAGRYYQELRRVSDLAKPDHCKFIDEYLVDFGMENRDAWRESFWHKMVEPGEKISTNLTVKKETFEELSRDLQASICRISSNLNEKFAKCENKASLLNDLTQNTLMVMLKGTDAEIVPPHARAHQFMFRNAEPIRNFAHLDATTGDMLKDGWDLLLSVAETGEWLYNRLQKRNSMQGVRVIIADSLLKKDLEDRGAKVKQLPWYDHNRHMTIRLKRKLGVVPKGDLPFEPKSAIYFERRQRTTLISPYVLGKNAADLQAALDDFTIYWIKSENHEEGRSTALSLDPINLRERQIEMLNSFLP